MKISATFALAILIGSFLYPQSTRAASVTLTPITGLGRLHGINLANQVAGYTLSGDDVEAFVYEKGTITSIDIPGSSESAVYGIENNGRVVGSYNAKTAQGNVATHGFLYFHGDVTTIDYPGADATVAHGINDPQRIVGYYRPTSSGHYSGFFYDKKNFTSFDGPSAVNTYAMGINNPGDIVGYYTSRGNDGEYHDHGFLYDKKGNLTTIDAAFPLANVKDTQCYGINSSGIIVGTYIDDAGTHGFVDIGGVFLSVDAPGTPPGVGTFIQGINDNGQLTVFGTTAFLGNIVQ